jgi:hypothetical protein
MARAPILMKRDDHSKVIQAQIKPESLLVGIPDATIGQLIDYSPV